MYLTSTLIMATPKINFDATIASNRGLFDFTIKRLDGTNVFTDSSGNPIDYSQLINTVGSYNWNMDLPIGDYEIYLVVVTNVNFDFAVTGITVALTPKPATIKASKNLIFYLTVS